MRVFRPGTREKTSGATPLGVTPGMLHFFVVRELTGRFGTAIGIQHDDDGGNGGNGEDGDNGNHGGGLSALA